MKEKVMKTLIDILENELYIMDNLTYGANPVLKKHLENAIATMNMMKQCLDGTCFENKYNK